MTRQITTYFAESTNSLEDRVRDLMERGGVVVALSIGYGPPPARVIGQAHAPEAAWHAMVVYDWPDDA
jgi:hypothetical protein